MYVMVAKDRSVTLVERDNFRGFKLVVEGAREDIEPVREALSGAAELIDADTAWIFEAWLRARPDGIHDDQWQSALSAMIDKARPHGWIDDARNAIKAHVEWRA